MKMISAFAFLCILAASPVLSQDGVRGGVSPNAVPIAFHDLSFQENPFPGSRVHLVTASDFLPDRYGVDMIGGDSEGVYPAAPGWLRAPLRLPNGSLVVGWQIYGCNGNQDGGLVRVEMFSYHDDTDTAYPMEIMSHEGYPGCGARVGSIGWPDGKLIDNYRERYSIYLGTALMNGLDKLRWIRIYYFPEVGRAPTIATFSDVPTSHPFYRFIEALAAAGVTGGCGDGKFCPNAPITRGQMAVFLASSLGLSFPVAE